MIRTLTLVLAALLGGPVFAGKVKLRPEFFVAWIIYRWHGDAWPK